MADYAELLDAINRAAGLELVPDASIGVAGGDINQAVQVFDQYSRPCFLKLNEARFVDMFAAEFEGLEELSQASELKIPTPIAYGESAGYAWLLLEWLDLRPATAIAAKQLGRALAGMHRIQAKEFGWKRDNTIGRIEQINTPSTDWVSFYADRRLGYQLDLADENGAGESFQKVGEQLREGLGAFFADYQPRPSLLHGDLWGGNWGMLADGRPALFDPAVYYGDREADIAMTRLFGGFDEGFYREYAAAWPLDYGFERRQDLYNLYHVLNHYNLFGGHYLAQAERMLKSLVSQL